MFRIAGLLLFSSIAVSGCVAVSTRMVSTDTAVISAADDEASVPEARSKALVAAARLARERGFEYFGVLAAREGATGQFTYAPAQIPDLAGGAVSGRVAAEVSNNEAATELTVRFLHPADLPANRAGIYAVSAVLAGRS